MRLEDLLTLSVERRASDLHLSAGMPPMLRIDGDVREAMEDVVSHEQVLAMAYSVMTEKQQADYELTKESDFSTELPGIARFRVNLFQQSRGAGAVIRVIPSQIATLEQLGCPEIFKRIAQTPRGLVLVTGPTGSGKSTTLAAMIDYINETRAEHVLTIEDPIEFVYKSKKSLINQREVHRDTQSFANALRGALREDPDVILVGEMRDPETIGLALTAAETGHLVFGTLHTSSAAKTIDRIIDVFPAAEQAMVRTMLAESLRAVISQILLKKKEGGRVAAHEILISNPAIRNLIRENKIPQINSAMQVGHQHGMQTLEQSMVNLVKQGVVTKDEALSRSDNREI